MNEKTFTLLNEMNQPIHLYQWMPDEEIQIKGVIQLAHGLAEHAARYKRFAEFCTKSGWIVVAGDHRGHGLSAPTVEQLGIHVADTMNGMVRDLQLINKTIHEEYADLPVFLMGHSMGSMLTQSYMTLYGDTVRGVILSGTMYKQPKLKLVPAIWMATRMINKNGEHFKNGFFEKMTFGPYNKAFQPNRTDFDWLSRDEHEVDEYVNSPYCGFQSSVGFYRDIFAFLLHLHEDSKLQRIPKNLPIYLYSGDRDPVGNFGKDVVGLYDHYLQIGIEDVQIKLYPEGRHEMLNETNRDEVMRDIMEWLEAHR